MAVVLMVMGNMGLHERASGNGQGMMLVNGTRGTSSMSFEGASDAGGIAALEAGVATVVLDDPEADAAIAAAVMVVPEIAGSKMGERTSDNSKASIGANESTRRTRARGRSQGR